MGNQADVLRGVMYLPEIRQGQETFPGMDEELVETYCPTDPEFYYTGHFITPNMEAARQRTFEETVYGGLFSHYADGAEISAWLVCQAALQTGANHMDDEDEAVTATFALAETVITLDDRTSGVVQLGSAYANAEDLFPRLISGEEYAERVVLCTRLADMMTQVAAGQAQEALSA